jgi:MFS family permease
MPVRHQLRVIAAASAALTMGVMPVFLIGALSAEMGADLGYGSARTGLAITIFFASGAITAVTMGGVTERIGASRAMRLGVVIAGLVLLGIGFLASAWWHLAVLAAISGTGIALIDTGGARSFADAIRVERHGTAFGIKEASIPVASMLAGISIPLLVGRFGWSAAFIAGACLVPVVVWLVPGHLRSGPAPASPVTGPGGGERSGLVLFAVGVAAGSAATSAGATLFVPAVTDAGWSSSSAGSLLAGASVVSIVTRITLGWSSDRAPTRTWMMLVGSLVLGAAGAMMLALAVAGFWIVAGAILLVGAGWGWSGLAFLSAVRARPHAPAVAAGIVLTGLAGGGASGPALFGIMASTWSYSAAWSAAAGALVVSATIAVFTRHSYRPRSVTGTERAG